MKLFKKKALITGGSQGLGLAIARAFVQEGASISLCARGKEALEKAREELLPLAQEGAKVISLVADVAREEDVKNLIARALEELGGLDILVCNAGVYGPMGLIHQIDWTKWVEAIQINLLGTVLPCREIIPHFQKQNRGKIVILSGGGATKGMPYFSAYAASKAGVVRFAETLAGELENVVDVNCIAPGALNTRLLDDILDAGPEKVGEDFYKRSLKQKEEGGVPLELGASLCVFLASKESDGISGKLVSAQWDPWKDLPAHLDDLKNTDIYTLRRIIPGERGKDWGDV